MSIIATFARANPMAFGVGFSCAKTSVSDLVVQVFVERRENIDWKRNAAFASFGFGYLGIVQYSLYVPVFSRQQQWRPKPLLERGRDKGPTKSDTPR